MNQTGRESAREAVREPNGQAPRAPDGESVETALQLAIDLHGPGLLSRPDKLGLHLEAQCPNAGFDIAFLLVALEEKVPQALLAMNSVLQMQTVVPQLQEMLAERRGLNPFAATWAVSTWAAALRMDLFGDPAVRGSVRSDGSVRPSSARPSEAPLAHPAADDEPRTFSAETTAAPPPFTVPFGIPAKAKPVVEVASPPPLAQSVEPRIVVPFLARTSEPSPVPAAEAVDTAPTETIVRSEVVEPIVAPVPPAHVATPPLRAEPIAAAPPHKHETADTAAPPPDDDITIIRHDGPLVPAPTPPAADAALPVWAAGKKKSTAPQSRPFKPWWGLAGVIAAVIVAAAAIRLTASMNDQDVAPTAAAPAPAAEAVPAPSTTPPAPIAATPAAPAPAATTPTPPSIVDVVSDGTLLGDGAEHAVFVAIDPARRDVRSVEATFMAGDGQWEPRSRVFDVQPDAVHDGRIPVGHMGLRATKPATATVQYVVTTVDGERSTPFVKQFVFAPVAARAPVIADIVVPSGIVAGTPFTLTIRFTPGESGIASVERATIGADGPPRTTSLAGLASPKEGTLRYPVEAIASASRTTYAFTLIDRDGARSEPRRIVVEVAAPKREADRSVEAAVPRPDVVACTRATCGSVVSVREIDRTKTYEVIARMDDRSITSMVSTAQWKVGTRVRRAGSRLAPVDVVVAPARSKAAARAPSAARSESPPIFDR